MKKCLNSLLVITLTVAIVFSFSFISLPSLAYADGEYDLGNEVMDFSEGYSCSYSGYKIVEEYDPDTGPYDAVVFDEKDHQIRLAVNNTLRSSGAAIFKESEWFSYFDLDNDGNNDLVFNLDDEEGKDIDYYYPDENRHQSQSDMGKALLSWRCLSQTFAGSRYP